MFLNTSEATAANQATIIAYLAKLDTTLVLDGAVYQFTTNALEKAPGGTSSVNVIIGASSVELDNIDSLGNLTIHRGDTFSVAITDLDDLSDYSKVYFTVKRKYDDTDADAIIMMEATEGLTVLNGTAISGTGTYPDCSLTVAAGTGGDITIVLSEEVTSALEARETWVYDIQMIKTDGTVHTLGYGKVTVNKDVTQAIT